MSIHSVLRIPLLATLFVLFVHNNATGLQQSADVSDSAVSVKKACAEINCVSDGGATPASTSAAIGSADGQKEPADDTVTIKKVLANLPGDQKAIWTSPFRVHARDSIWLAPMLGTAGVLIGSDQHSMQRERYHADAVRRTQHIAKGGTDAIIAVPALMYAWGSWRGNSKERETGLLSGEALVNSLAVNEALKLVFARQRPTLTDGQGKFFSDISNASFPSAHSMLSWTAASVIAHEYPGPLTQILAYGTATAVSISRVTGRQHFPSDVMVGGAFGWFIGRQVYKAHHDPALEGPGYGSFLPDPKEVDPSKLGSTFVPLDSWIYPALERLAALGYIKTQFTGLRPCTRHESLRQPTEAENFAQDLPAEPSVPHTFTTCPEQFRPHAQHYQTFSIDSLY